MQVKELGRCLRHVGCISCAVHAHVSQIFALYWLVLVWSIELGMRAYTLS